MTKQGEPMAQTTVRKIPDPPPMTDAEADALIARYIRQDPYHPGRHEAIVDLEDRSVSVWTIIGYLDSDEGWRQAAADYDLPADALAAALAYYARHRALIDAKLLLERESLRAFESSLV
jgi:uncharacterized protein (DUF433 family)